MLHIDSADRSLLSDAVTENGIRPGELIYFQEGGGCRRATGADDRIDAIVEDFADDHIAEHQEDYRQSMEDFTYDVDDGDTLAAGGGEDSARLRARTPSDNGSADPPAIQQWSIVGIADAGGDYAGRLVEEGYSPDGGTTVYERASGNFNPLGMAAGSDPKTHITNGVNSFDEMFHVIVRKDL